MSVNTNTACQTPQAQNAVSSNTEEGAMADKTTPEGNVQPFSIQLLSPREKHPALIPLCRS